MDKLYVLCVDDQREVLNALTQDLEPFETSLMIEECESVNEAWEVMESIDANGDHVAILITDQVMPANTGVDLLKRAKSDPRFQDTRTVLLTGLATHQDTIDAINTAHLDNYVEKPWSKEGIHQIIKVLTTKYLLSKGIDYNEYTEVLDQQTLFETLRKTT